MIILYQHTLYMYHGWLFIVESIVIVQSITLSLSLLPSLLPSLPPPLSLFYPSPQTLRLDTVQQTKARLELSTQTIKQQHQKELEGRDEEIEQLRTTMNKKLKSLNQQLEEMHEEKQSAVKVSDIARVV